MGGRAPSPEFCQQEVSEVGERFSYRGADHLPEKNASPRAGSYRSRPWANYNDGRTRGCRHDTAEGVRLRPKTTARRIVMDESMPTMPGDRPPRPSERVDGACDRFEAAWRAGQQPRIDD